MNRDNVYIFDKITFERSLLGEIQTDFNMSFTIDGTKDSSTIIVKNYSVLEVEPYTILWHEKTQTWWIVSHDKVEKHMNEDGFCYTHNLDLLGAIELLNARDLIDCGFNDQTYTIREFIDRLFSLSTFEYDFTYNTNLQLYKEVDFIKTFENYTLLSALREFLDAYNSCGKLTFATRTQGNKVYIDHAILNILLKTGNPNLEKHDIEDFEYVQETRTIDKNSFGTCVVSNANNVVSSQTKTYPATGLVGFSGNTHTISYSSALLRLPSNIYDINWLKMISPTVRIGMFVQKDSTSVSDGLELPYENDAYSIGKLRNAIEGLRSAFISFGKEDWYNEWINNVENIWQRAKDCFTVTFYANCEYKPPNNFVKPDSVPYFPTFKPRLPSTQGGGDPLKVILCNKNVKQNMEKTQQGIAWERGSNLITGFEILQYNPYVDTTETDGYYWLNKYGGTFGSSVYLSTYHYETTIDNSSISCGIEALTTANSARGFLRFDIDDNGSIFKTVFRVNYVPMADMKLKVDNNRDKKDIQLYNQNGKLSDSYALSKLLNSYSKEISSNNITRYNRYYNFNDVPKAGSFVNVEHDTYVVNNVSLNFEQHENSGSQFGYFIDCEINMCKYVSTKSLMVSPNSNIRDYGIPQNYNVKRKQVYRDYYELAYGLFDDANQSEPYIPLEKVVPFENGYVPNGDYFVYLKLTYSNLVENSYVWYYQIDCSTIVLQKQMVLMCEIMDNNIIGYCQANREFIFDVSNLFNQSSLINTPISYVDDKGNVKDFEVLFINQENRGTIDETYYLSQGMQSFPTYDALTTQVFIPQELYEIAYNNEYYQFKLDLIDYKKDALEVPVFEYICQVDDSEDVLIGDNILQQYEDCIYFYHLVIGNQGEVMTTNTVWDISTVDVLELEPIMEMNNVVMITYNSADHEIRLTRYQKAEYNKETNEYGFTNQIPFPTGVDICVYRHAINKNAEYDSDDYEYHKEPMFICKNVSEENIYEDILVLKINHYKLN